MIQNLPVMFTCLVIGLYCLIVRRAMVRGLGLGVQFPDAGHGFVLGAVEKFPQNCHAQLGIFGLEIPFCGLNEQVTKHLRRLTVKDRKK